jgi:hypothetical protein
LTLPLLPVHMIVTKIAFVLCFKIMMKNNPRYWRSSSSAKKRTSSLISGSGNDLHNLNHCVKSIEKMKGEKKLQQARFISELIHIVPSIINSLKQAATRFHPQNYLNLPTK